MTPQEGPVTALAFQRGAGRTIVFLHGYPLNHSMWTPQIDCLGNSERVVLFALPGYGSASGSEVPSDLSGFSESVYMALKENSMDRSVIVGHSFGGLVADDVTDLRGESVSHFQCGGTFSFARTNSGMYFTGTAPSSRTAS